MIEIIQYTYNVKKDEFFKPSDSVELTKIHVYPLCAVELIKLAGCSPSRGPQVQILTVCAQNLLFAQSFVMPSYLHTPSYPALGIMERILRVGRGISCC